MLANKLKEVRKAKGISPQIKYNSTICKQLGKWKDNSKTVEDALINPDTIINLAQQTRQSVLVEK